MELCAHQPLSWCCSSVPSIGSCSTSYLLTTPVLHTGCRLVLPFSSFSVTHRGLWGFPARETNVGRFHGRITVAGAVAVVEDEDTEERRRGGKKGFQPLGNKEKKELRAYAHSLGKEINMQQVGKLGITPNVITSISDALEANEIIKVKVLENCDSDQDEIIAQLEEGTGAQTVGKIGRTLLLYRASLKKLSAAEEKKKAEKPKRRSRLAMSAGRSTLKSRRSTQ